MHAVTKSSPNGYFLSFDLRSTRADPEASEALGKLRVGGLR